MAQCLAPFMRKDGNNKDAVCPCGRCPNCIKRRISAWSFRLMQEEKISSSAHFLTLTYGVDHVPITDKGYMTLCKDDFQKFMKRLRKENDEKLKYYMCGEYGGKTWRPHYHVILFNVQIETVQKAWYLGQIHYGQVSEASVGYTLKYMFKASKIPQHKNDDRVKEFSLMSKGLGKNYLTEAMVNWHKADPVDRQYCNIGDGKKIAMPRYFKDKIFTQEEKDKTSIKMSEIAMKEKEKQYEKDPLTDHYRNQKEAKEAAYRKLASEQQKRNKI